MRVRRSPASAFPPGHEGTATAHLPGALAARPRPRLPTALPVLAPRHPAPPPDPPPPGPLAARPRPRLPTALPVIAPRHPASLPDTPLRVCRKRDAAAGSTAPPRPALGARLPAPPT